MPALPIYIAPITHAVSMALPASLSRRETETTLATLHDVVSAAAEKHGADRELRITALARALAMAIDDGGNDAETRSDRTQAAFGKVYQALELVAASNRGGKA